MQHYRFKNVIIRISEISTVELREQFQKPGEYELCIVSHKDSGMFGVGHHVIQVPCSREEGEAALNEIAQLLK